VAFIVEMKIHVDREALKPFACKYLWWKTPDEAVLMPERIIAQVMNMGDYSDVQLLAAQIGDAVLGEVLTHAGAGQFNERSWAYWHYRLGLSDVDCVPALPRRNFG
jgi:hypothetical protein